MAPRVRRRCRRHAHLHPPAAACPPQTHVVTPLWSALTALLPELAPQLQVLRWNSERYRDLVAAGATTASGGGSSSTAAAEDTGTGAGAGAGGPDAEANGAAAGHVESAGAVSITRHRLQELSAELLPRLLLPIQRVGRRGRQHG